MKFLKKNSRLFIISSLLLMLFFGRAFYIFFFLVLFYVILYAVAFNKVKVSLTTSISTYTLTLNSRFTMSYTLSAFSFLPMKYTYEVMLPFYVVEVSSSKTATKFLRALSVQKTIVCKSNRRGTYEVGTIELSLHDPFALFSRTITIKDLKKIFVFPNLVPIERLGIRLTDPFEGKKAKFRINFDYSYVASVRDYTEHDPVSLIHWKQTAHRGKIQVKEFDFSASKKIFLVLNYFGKSIKFQDYASSVAASIIHYANRNHLPFGTIINSKPVSFLSAKTGEFHMLQNFKLLSEEFLDSIPTLEFIKQINKYVDFGSEVFYIDKEIDFEILKEMLKMNSYISKLNVILLVDETFVFPREKPPHYYFKEPESIRKILEVKEVLERERIYVYPIFGKDYLRLLEG